MEAVKFSSSQHLGGLPLNYMPWGIFQKIDEPSTPTPKPPRGPRQGPPFKEPPCMPTEIPPLEEPPSSKRSNEPRKYLYFN